MENGRTVQKRWVLGCRPLIRGEEHTASKDSGWALTSMGQGRSRETCLKQLRRVQWRKTFFPKSHSQSRASKSPSCHSRWQCSADQIIQGNVHEKSSRQFKPQKLVLTRMAKGVDGLKRCSYSSTKFKSQNSPYLGSSIYAPYPSLPSHSRSTTEPPHPFKGVGGRAGQ